MQHLENFTIREMSVADLRMAISWAAAEGWNPGIYDAESFYSADPHGFFMAFEGNTPLGCVSAVAYDENFGFIGFFIVRNDLRGHHIGIELGKTALNYLGNRCIGQDGVLKKVKNYEHYGFKTEHVNIRYEGIARKTPKLNAGLIPLSEVPFPEICRYDRLHFPADRSNFLEKWISQRESCALGILDAASHLSGYGVIRKCVKGYKIGPLFANSAEVAEEIFLGLANFAAEGEPFYLDLPEPNKSALALACKYRMTQVFSTARMYRGAAPELPVLEIFGITSFELG